MAAHRYWRLLIHTNGSGDAWCAVAQFDGYTVLGGANVLTGGVASASSVYAAGYEASKAFDGVPSSAWITNSFADGTWLKYDLGAGNEKDLVGFAFYARSDGWYNQSPRHVELQYSDDDVTYTTLFDVTAPTMTAASQQYIYPVPPGVYVSKANIAVESVPPSSVVVSKANVAVGSLPQPVVMVSKANLAVESDIPAAGSGGRRRMSLM